MNFSPARASSIDLFVSEVAAHSRLEVEIVAEADEPSLPAARLHRLPSFAYAATVRRARFIAELAQARAAALIVVQQHLPTAAAIAARVPIPVMLQRHNFMRPPKLGLIGGLRRRSHARELNALAGLTFVSEAAREEFCCRLAGRVDAALGDPERRRNRGLAARRRPRPFRARRRPRDAGKRACSKRRRRSPPDARRPARMERRVRRVGSQARRRLSRRGARGAGAARRARGNHDRYAVRGA